MNYGKSKVNYLYETPITHTITDLQVLFYATAAYLCGLGHVADSQ